MNNHFHAGENILLRTHNISVSTVGKLDYSLNVDNTFKDHYLVYGIAVRKYGASKTGFPLVKDSTRQGAFLNLLTDSSTHHYHELPLELLAITTQIRGYFPTGGLKINLNVSKIISTVPSIGRAFEIILFYNDPTCK